MQRLRDMYDTKAPLGGVVHISQVARFRIFLKSASGLLPDGWVGLKSFGYRCHFRAFQLELDTLDTQNIGNGPVVEELQPLEVGRIPENSTSAGPSDDMGNLIAYLCLFTFGTAKKVFPYFVHFLSPI